MKRYFLGMICFLLAGCGSMPSYESGDKKALHHIGSDLYGAYDPYIKEQAQMSYLPPWEKDGPGESFLKPNGVLFQDRPTSVCKGITGNGSGPWVGDGF